MSKRKPTGDNLWGDFKLEDLPPPVESPKKLLREQAAFLAERTNGLLGADIHTKAGSAFHEVEHEFYINAPVIGLRVLAFTLSHDHSKYYPLRISGRYAPAPGYCQIQCKDKEQYAETLKQALQGKELAASLKLMIEESRSKKNSFTVYDAEGEFLDYAGSKAKAIEVAQRHLQDMRTPTPIKVYDPMVGLVQEISRQEDEQERKD